MEISFYLKRPDANETSIYARICYEGYQLKYYISEKINPKFWNKIKMRAKQDENYKEYPEFNQRLNDITSTIHNVYRNYLKENKNQIPEPKDFRILLDKELKNVIPQDDKIKTFFGFFEDLINQTKNGGRVQPKSGKPFKKATIQIYQNTFKRLVNFQAKSKRKIDFNTIDLDFYTEFVEYLSKRLKLGINTMGKDIKIIKVVMSEATERGLNSNMQFKSKRFSTMSEETDSIYLTETELNEIESLDLMGNDRLENVRDLFLIACYTGLRYSDFSILTMKQMNEGFIEIKEQTKTEKPVIIPIHNKVKMIVNKYNGKLPKSISNANTNLYLKEIGEQVNSLKEPFTKTFTKIGMKVSETVEKWEKLCTHTGRRSFATNEYKNGTPTITIMAITGHKTEKAFLKYIKLNPMEHAIIMKQHWDNRNQLKAV
jgi:integrase